ncbi:hypothetical protein SISSUDRAFT_1038663 [Sistotremastrum suecicum HHB10207 ss-3]|uniref:CxC1-like cysteine cluster associated with KDZ transposases domain-containing protein n=1 Tax=Sistotremastrum suecicum HHB10207 ss-3 TaxID=1314776 RepID=A0A165WGZ5_9AGAM|nr:hypothetical protein SISSUDRAFT_1038663 [Sistotremastrum suecicum HHB10207 ss-3]
MVSVKRSRSGAVRGSTSKITSLGTSIPQRQQVYTPKLLKQAIDATRKARIDRYNTSSTSERQAIRDSEVVPLYEDGGLFMDVDYRGEPSDSEWEDEDDGGERDSCDLVRGYCEMEATEGQHRYKAPDNRDRRDRLERQNIAWGYIMEDLTDAFLSWSAENDSKNDENQFETVGDFDDSSVEVFHMYSFKRVLFPFDPAVTSVVLLAKHGLMATSPGNPARAFSFSVLRFYHALSNRCPQLSMQVFVKSLCHLHCNLK